MSDSSDTNLKKNSMKHGLEDEDNQSISILQCLHQYIKSNKIIFAMAVFFVIVVSVLSTFFVIKYHHQSYANIPYEHDEKITTLSNIQKRLLNSSDSYDIGILIIVTEEVNMTEYGLALDTLKCYSKLHNYGFDIEMVNDTWKEICNQTDFMFLRHCITAHLLHRHEWTLFLDADVGVANPSKLIDTFIPEDADLIFFDRFFNEEIAAGSYLAANSSYSKEFLLKFANTEFSMPKNAYGTDNGAIHWLFVKEFYSNETTSKFSSNDCYNIWSLSRSYGDLYVFEACCRLILGETRLFHDPNGKGSVKIIPKGEGWMRDVWLIRNKWSSDSDFMLHGWKKSTQLPEADKTKFGVWYSVIANPSFDLDTCSNGTIQWQWWSSYMISNSERQRLFMKKREEVKNEFSKYESLIPKYLKKFY